MDSLTPKAVKSRLDMVDIDTYIVYGLIPKDASVSACLCGEPVSLDVDKWSNYSAAERLVLTTNEDLIPSAIRIKLPRELPTSGRLELFAKSEGKRVKWFSRTCEFLKKQGRNPQAFVEQVRRFSPREVVVSGWVASDLPVRIRAYGSDKEEIVAQKITFARPDVQNAFPECPVIKDCGFQLAFKNLHTSEVKLVFENEHGCDVYTFPMGRVNVLIHLLTKDVLKAVQYLQENGFLKFCDRVIKRLKKEDRPVEYKEWLRHNLTKKEVLDEQRQARFDKEPLVSIVVPLYKTKESFLDALVTSVKEQTYKNWELCLSDGSGAPSPIAEKLKTLAGSDERIRVIEAGKQRRIVENTNAALAESSGEYIAFADHDDLLSPDALYEVVKAINEQGEPDLIYSDEDKVNETGKKFFEPHMKPDYNPDLLRSMNYISHLCVIKRSLLERIGYLDEKFEGAQDYDLILRAVEKAEKIYHIPKVLYHWRSHEASTAENPESKKYAFEAGRRAVQAHYGRLGIDAEVIDGEWSGLYRTRYIRRYDPLVSIVIPNKDHIDDLDRCISSIVDHTTYKNYEFIIIENNSDESETFEYYKKVEAKNPNIHVVYYDGKFNYSKINNFGARHANGEYLLLLNNDTSMINADCLEELLGYCMRGDVGAVGARLYYEDDTVQHAGVVMGFGGIAGHCFVNQKRGSTGYCHRIICAQDYSVVTAACMMVKKSVFEEVGGFTEELAVAFNDVDFCLKLRKAGYLVVYNPYAESYHYESKSRGLENTPQKMSRFNTEISYIFDTWGEIIENGDPYYNPNLTLSSQDFSLNKNW